MTKCAKLFSPAHMGPRSNLVSKIYGQQSRDTVTLRNNRWTFHENQRKKFFQPVVGHSHRPFFHIMMQRKKCFRKKCGTCAFDTILLMHLCQMFNLANCFLCEPPLKRSWTKFEQRWGPLSMPEKGLRYIHYKIGITKKLSSNIKRPKWAQFGEVKTTKTNVQKFCDKWCRIRFIYLF